MILKCEYCEKRFNAKTCAKYCSPACRQASYRRNRSEKLKQLRQAENQTMTFEEHQSYMAILDYCGSDYAEYLNTILLVTTRTEWLQVMSCIRDLMSGSAIMTRMQTDYEQHD